MARDDAIAAWEAFQREEHVTDCMRSAGFEYHPDLRFPRNQLQDIAKYLGVETGGEPDTEGFKANQKYQESLDEGVRDEYFSALYGISAETYDNGDSGKDDTEITLRGCYSDAVDSVDSVWALRRTFAEEILSLSTEAKDPGAMEGAERGYAKCAADMGARGSSNPRELEAARQDNPDLVSRVGDACNPPYYEAYTASLAGLQENFISAHPAVAEQRARYASALEEMRSDFDFMAMLGA